MRNLQQNSRLFALLFLVIFIISACNNNRGVSNKTEIPKDTIVLQNEETKEKRKKESIEDKKKRFFVKCADTILNDISIIDFGFEMNMKLKDFIDKKIVFPVNNIKEPYEYYNKYRNQDEIFLINKSKTIMASIGNNLLDQFTVRYLNKHDIINDSLLIRKIDTYIYDFNHIDTVYYFRSKYTNFITGKGIHLGMSLKKLQEIYNNCDFDTYEISKDTILVVKDWFDEKYSNNHPEYDHLYFARYLFIKNKLNEFRYGHHVP